MSDVLFQKPDGSFVYVDSSEAGSAKRKGYVPATREQFEASKQEGRAFVEGVARGATFGLSDPFLEGFGVKPAELEARRQENPVASVLGALLPVSILFFYLARRFILKRRAAKTTSAVAPVGRRWVTRERALFLIALGVLGNSRCSLQDELDGVRLEAWSLSREISVTKQALDECVDERDELQDQVDRMGRR